MATKKETSIDDIDTATHAFVSWLMEIIFLSKLTALSDIGSKDTSPTIDWFRQNKMAPPLNKKSSYYEHNVRLNEWSGMKWQFSLIIRLGKHGGKCWVQTNSKKYPQQIKVAGDWKTGRYLSEICFNRNMYIYMYICM